MDRLLLDANVVVDFLCERSDDFYLANDPLAKLATKLVANLNLMKKVNGLLTK